MNKIELENKIKLHKMWLEDKEGGIRLNLEGADLSRADLSGADLEGANLSRADLEGADLQGADLSRADLECADLIGADLIGANLRYADLSRADLSNAYLKGANLSGANLEGANIDNVKFNETTSFFALQCPEKGSFIAYKKAHNYIIELLITEDSKRSSATSRKCRCSKAKVISITNLDGTKSNITEITSNYNNSFIYKVGKIVEVKNFDEDRWSACSTGIHFFITRQEAVNYQ